MSLKSKIEAVIYASEEPVTLQQLVGLLADEAQAELDELASLQTRLPLESDRDEAVQTSARNVLEAGTREPHVSELATTDVTMESRAVDEGEVVSYGASGMQTGTQTDLSDPAKIEAGSAPANPMADEAVTQTPADASVSRDDEAPAGNAPEEGKRQQRERERAVREHIRKVVDTLMRDYAESGRGIEIREVASGFRMGTKPEYHDAVRGFVKSLKPALKLSLPALETLAVVAYKQPVTAAEISEIRGVDSAGVLGGLMTRKLIATAGRKQVIGRPMLYKTTRDFLMRFGLKDVNELPSMEEFERMAGELAEQEDLPMETTDAMIEQANARGDAEHLRDTTAPETGDTFLAEHVNPPIAPEAAAVEHGGHDGFAVDISHPTLHDATAESAAGGNNENTRTEKHSAELGEGTHDAEEVSHEGAEQPA